MNVRTQIVEVDTRHPVDIHVGAMLRKFRKQRTPIMSQQVLGDALGLTFQQVQKYENGNNRISASKLYDAATALNLPVSAFFEGLQDPALQGEAPEFMEEIAALMTMPESSRWVRALLAMPTELRNALLSSIETQVTVISSVAADRREAA